MRSWSDAFTAMIFLAFLLLISIGTNPFTGGSGLAVDKSGAGEGMRQILMLLLLAAAAPLLVLRRHQMQGILFANRSILILFGWALLSIMWSDVIGIAAHRLISTLLCASFTLLGVTLAPRSLVNVLLALTGSVMAINYTGILLIPDRSIDHLGFWSGLHAQKNVAGYFSAISALLWLFMGAYRRSIVLLAGALAWFVFLLFTHSGTSIGMFLFVLLLGIAFGVGVKQGIGRHFFLFFLISTGVVLPLYFYFGLTMIADLLGYQPLANLDFTFTGRTDIWAFVLERVTESPLLGTGYGSFWAIGDYSPSLMYATKFVAQYTEAHSGYLDVMVSLGVIGLILMIIALLKPYGRLWGYEAANTDTASAEAILCGLVLLSFGILHNSLESTLLQGMSPMWTLMLMSMWIVSSKLSSDSGAVDGNFSRRITKPDGQFRSMLRGN
tara:strand:+ start:9099 stop:10418 length:1320 start_codon:yes stop_codon:yes gene_type:complete